GMYLMLVSCMDCLHRRFIREVDEMQVPRLDELVTNLRSLVAKTKRSLAVDPANCQENANLRRQQENIEACELLKKELLEHRDLIRQENQQIQPMLETAKNTYETVKLSKDIADIIGVSREAFQSLRDLRLPKLRIFENRVLKNQLLELRCRIKIT